MPSDSSDQIRIGDLAVKKGLVSEADLTQCLLDQKTMALMGIKQRVGEIMVGKGLLRRRTMRKLLQEQQKLTGKHIIIGRYEIISKPGEGGFGAVYKARLTGSERLVAVKVLPPALARNRDYVARFRREAKVAARLNHPNIVMAIEAGKSAGYNYFAMEYVPGESAAKRIDRKGSFPESEALAVAYYMASALQYAHQEGLVHRDIKPDNIFLTQDGGAKLGDLGLARFTDESATRLTVSGTIIGSPYYISPEQVRGDRKVDIRSDIYSLGATLYHMTTGQVPFDGENVVSVLNMHINEKLPWPADVKHGLSNNICHLITNMMAKAPSDRYQTPHELLVDLHHVLNGRNPSRSMPSLGESSIARGTTAIVPPLPGAPPAEESQIRIQPAPSEVVVHVAPERYILPPRPPKRPVRWPIALTMILAGAALTYVMLPTDIRRTVKEGAAQKLAELVQAVTEAIEGTDK